MKETAAVFSNFVFRRRGALLQSQHLEMEARGGEFEARLCHMDSSRPPEVTK